jgi:hypothetical protein
MTTPTTTTELHPAWDNARNYLAGVQQAFRMSIAGQVLVGMELMSLKKDLGFVLGNNQHGRNGQSVQSSDRTWSEWVSAELGISYKTADRLIMMWDAARARIKKIGHTGDLPGGTKKLALICDARPTTLAQEDREKLAAVVERITDGTTQADLLEELRLVKKPALPPSTAGQNNRKPPTDDPVEQMAFTFWLGGGNQIMEIRQHGSQFLNMLPVESSDPEKPGLRLLREETAALLADIDAAINANLKPTTGRTL